MTIYNRIKFEIKEFWYNLRSRFQRFKRGYADRDVWDMDYWFLSIVKPMLIDLRDHGHSFPGEFNNYDEWCVVLNEMIDCLDFMYEDNVQNFLGFVEDDYYRRMTIEDYMRINNIVDNNKNRFFELFSKYFYNLWD